MNWSEMSLSDLQTMQRLLAGLAEIGARLESLGDAPVAFDLRPGFPVVISGCFIMPSGAEEDEPVLIEDDAPIDWTTDDDRDIPDRHESKIEFSGRSVSVRTLDHFDLATDPDLDLCPGNSVGAPLRLASDASGRDGLRFVPPSDPVEKIDTPSNGAPANDPPVSGDATGDLLTGPLTEAEKAEARRMLADGLDVGQIAARMNRKKALIGSCLRNLIKAPPLGQPATGGAAAPAVVQAPPTPADPALLGRAAAKKTGEAAPEAGGAAEIIHRAPRPAFTLLQRQINAYLDHIGYPAPWDARMDCELVHGLTLGFKLGDVAVDMGLDSAVVKARWIELTAWACKSHGITIEEQRDLLAVLRVRAELAGRDGAQPEALRL